MSAWNGYYTLFSWLIESMRGVIILLRLGQGGACLQRLRKGLSCVAPSPFSRKRVVALIWTGPKSGHPMVLHTVSREPEVLAQKFEREFAAV